MSKTPEGVIFCVHVPFALSTRVEARWSTFVCPTLLMYPQLWPETLYGLLSSCPGYFQEECAVEELEHLHAGLRLAETDGP